MKIFLSYAPKDKNLADEIAANLSRIADIRRDDSLTGTMTDYSAQIAACDKLIVLVSLDANTSQRVAAHIFTAQQQKIETLLFRRDDVSVIAYLPDITYHKLPDDLNIEWFETHLCIPSVSTSINTKAKIAQHKENLHTKHSTFFLADKTRKVPIEKGYVDCYVREGFDNTSALMVSSSLINNMPNGLVVIAGHPGTGKTTLLNYICYKMSDSASQSLPVFVSLKEFSIYCESFEGFIFSGVNASLSLCILRQANDDYKNKCVVLFDGLDEVAPEVYDKIKVEINKIVANNAWLTCILTTRIDGYKNSKQADFRVAKPYTIAKLDNNILATYIDKWFVNDTPQADRIKKIILADVKLTELAQKAIFMLSLMCMMFEEDNTLESNMSLLYKKSVEFLVNTRRNLLDCEKTLRLEAFKIIALRFLQMQQKIFDGNLTEAIIESFLKEKLGSNNNEHAVDFLEKLITETGLLQKHDGDYSFTHLTFQEYFVAQATIDSKVFNLKSLLEYCNMPNWQETFRLYFGLLPSLKDKNVFLKKLSMSNFSLALRIISDHDMAQTQSVLIEILSHMPINEKSRIIRGVKTSLSTLDFEKAQKLAVDTVKPLLAFETNSEVLFFAIELLKEYDPDDKFQLMLEYFYKHQDEKFKALLSNSEFLFDFVDIPAGSFQMGESDSRLVNESPLHPVNLSQFRMAKYQLTNKAYEFIMGITSDRTPISSGDNQPVVNIDWYDAYICALRVGCRLPTEAEWEYAARAGTRTKWCFGDDESEVVEKIHCKETKADKTRPVDSGEANAWGLLNVHGNVWEWCSDWYDSYSTEALTDPAGPSNSDLNTRVRRGGGWIYHAEGCRSGFRYGSEPSYRHMDIGVRLVKNCENTKEEKVLCDSVFAEYNEVVCDFDFAQNEGLI